MKAFGPIEGETMDGTYLTREQLEQAWRDPVNRTKSADSSRRLLAEEQSEREKAWQRKAFLTRAAALIACGLGAILAVFARWKGLLLVALLALGGCTAAQVTAMETTALRILKGADAVVSAVEANQKTVTAALNELDSLAASSPMAEAVIGLVKGHITAGTTFTAHLILQAAIAEVTPQPAASPAPSPAPQCPGDEGGITFVGSRTAEFRATDELGVWTTKLETVAPVGSCDRCGRDVWEDPTKSRPNYRIVVVDFHSLGADEVFRGCERCLLEWLRQAPRFAPPKVPAPK